MPKLFSTPGSVLGLLGLLGSLTLSAQQNVAAPRSQEVRERAQPQGKVGEAYILDTDDQLTIHVVDLPEASDKPIRIDLKGEINLPLIGRIHAAGQTTEQLGDEIKERLKVYLEKPDVVVNVSEFRVMPEVDEPVSVLGAVASPGVHQLKGGKNLVEILSLAGGVRPDAGPSVKITRRIENGRIPLAGAWDDPTGQFSMVEINLNSLLTASPEKNILIYANDVVSVPRAEIVYVMGDVNKTGPILLSEGHSVSVLQAISESGGVLRTAATSQTKILRPIMGGPKRAELTIDLKKILKGQANDLPLLAGDILLVPSSDSKRARSRAIEIAIQAGTMIGTYGALH